MTLNHSGIVGAVVLAMVLVASCAPTPPVPSALECSSPPPDAMQVLTQAWHEYQPDQPMAWTVSIRRRLFALQALLLSAGMYDAPSTDMATAYAQYAPQFVRDLGASRNPDLADAFARLAATLEALRGRPDAELAFNCGLLAARWALRAAPIDVTTDWVVQVSTQGFAPYFQTSVQQLVREHSVACGASPNAASPPESVLTCTMQRVGF
jgi:hypothetical protein